VVVFLEEDDASGDDESDLTSVVFELLVDSVVVVGAGAGVGVTTVVVEGWAGAGACWQPTRVSVSVARAKVV
jgi:hypothetical protein